MRIRLSIKSKILLYILGTAILVLLLSVGYISIRFRQKALNDAIKITDAYAREYANFSQNKLSEYMDAVIYLGKTYETFDNIGEKNRRLFFKDILIKILRENHEFISAWTTWECYSLDSLDKLYANKPGSTVLGNFAVLYYKLNGEILLDSTLETDPDEVFTGTFYTIPKKSLKETILNPYYYSYAKDGSDEVLETSVIVPIIKNQKFLGVVGLDVELSTFDNITSKIKPFENSYAMLIANDGSYITHPKKVFIGKEIGEINPDLEDKYNLTDHIKNGIPFSFISKFEESEKEYYVSFAPVLIGNSNTPWSLAIAAPLKSIYQDANRKFYYALLIAIISIIILVIITRLISNSITRPLERINILIKKLNKADVKEIKYLAKTYKDEIGDIADSAYTLITWLNKTGDFAQKLKNEDLDAEYELLSEDDVLGRSLLGLRDRLKKAKKEEFLRDLENKQRNWASEGVAKFGEIARTSSENIEQYTYESISNLVKYIDASQGGIFVYNNEDPENIYLELKAAFAFDKKKMVEKKVKIGEGLVGSCALERKTVFLTELPDEYIKIRSGLGEDNPKNLLLVPLIFNEKVFGVIEISSFNVVKKYQIEFVEEISKIIASTINSVKINQQTNRLLSESKYTSEQMAQQEEEMRQNYEELQTTQEELVRTKEKNENRIKDINAIIDGINFGILITKTSGEIVDYNSMVLSITGYSRGELDNESLQLIFKSIKPQNLKINHPSIEDMLRKNGEEFKAEVIMNKIEQSDGFNYMFTIKRLS